MISKRLKKPLNFIVNLTTERVNEMNKTYHWEIQPKEEVKPHYLFTTTDSVLDAAKQFEEAWGNMSVMYIRKIAESKNFEYDEDFGEAI